jgi:hypothetical protein
MDDEAMTAEPGRRRSGVERDELKPTSFSPRPGLGCERAPKLPKETVDLDHEGVPDHRPSPRACAGETGCGIVAGKGSSGK